MNDIARVRQRMLYFGVIVFLLCTASTVYAQTECSIKIIQDGQGVFPQVENKLDVYKIKATEFKIEVSPISCSPSINILSDRSQIEYLIQTPVIFASGAYYMAGDVETADILNGARSGESPRSSLDEEIRMATRDNGWAKQKYNALCTTLGYCPTPAKPFSTSWPFLDPITLEYRGYAEFKRLTEFVPLSKASGKIYAVIYTQWQTITRSTYGGGERNLFYLLKPNIIVLDFHSSITAKSIKEEKLKLHSWIPDKVCFQSTAALEKNCDMDTIFGKRLELLSPDCLKQIESRHVPERNSDCFKEFTTMSQAARQEVEQCVYSHVSPRCKEQLILFKLRRENKRCMEDVHKTDLICGSGQNIDIKCHNDHWAEVEAVCSEMTQ